MCPLGGTIDTSVPLGIHGLLDRIEDLDPGEVEGRKVGVAGQLAVRVRRAEQRQIQVLVPQLWRAVEDREPILGRHLAVRHDLVTDSIVKHARTGDDRNLVDGRELVQEAIEILASLSMTPT